MSRPANPKPFRVTVTRFVGPDGRRCRSTDPGAVKVREVSRAYYADLTVKENGKPRRKRFPLETSDLGQAWVALRKLQRREKEKAQGITDDTLDQLARPLAEHVEDWAAVEKAKGTSAKQLHMLRHDVTHIAGLAGWKRLGDLSADSALKALARLQHEQGRSAQTRNHYLAHLRQFARWCVDTKPPRLRQDPLAGVKKVSVEADRRHDRRSPVDDEIDGLFGHLAGDSAAVRCGMSGPDRALGYKVSMATGFRAQELRSLSRESFDLEAGTATCRAAYDKRRRKATQPLPPWLVDELRQHFAAGGGCWGRFPEGHPGRLLKEDLAAAGVPYAVPGPDGPLFLDMHALRHFYVTQIANQPGMSPKLMMTLCRHSTPALSLRVYAKARQEDARAAVNQIPAIGAPACGPVPTPAPAPPAAGKAAG